MNAGRKGGALILLLLVCAALLFTPSRAAAEMVLAVPDFQAVGCMPYLGPAVAEQVRGKLTNRALQLNVRISIAVRLKHIVRSADNVLHGDNLNSLAVADDAIHGLTTLHGLKVATKSMNATNRDVILSPVNAFPMASTVRVALA